MTGASINTVTKLLVDAGNACAAYHDDAVRGLESRTTHHGRLQGVLGCGIHITPTTSHSLWLGEKMDDELAVLGMLQLE